MKITVIIEGASSDGDVQKAKLSGGEPGSSSMVKKRSPEKSPYPKGSRREGTVRRALTKLCEKLITLI